MKRRTSIRGIVMLAFAAVVVGLSIATLRHHFTPPVDVPLSPRPPATVAAVPPPPPTMHAPTVPPPPPAPPPPPPKVKTH
ncbi:hypothetical protein FHT43_003544 [Mycolicibacterium sp. BK607]|nr:hypothetical protein [Mycolicibacterium sp. BK607]